MRNKVLAILLLSLLIDPSHRKTDAFSAPNRLTTTLLNFRDRAVYEERFAVPTAPSPPTPLPKVLSETTEWQSALSNVPVRQAAFVLMVTATACGMHLDGWWHDANSLWSMLPLGAIGAFPLILRPIPHRSRFDIQDSSIRSYGADRGVVPLATSSRMGWAIGITALMEEVLYRFYLVNLLASLTGSYVLAILLQAAVYAAAQDDSEGFLAGVWYSLMTASTGSIFPAVIAHTFVDWHRQAVIHHEAVKQIEYVHQCDPELPLERFFCAFDSQQKGYLSRHDIGRALAYARLPPAETIPPFANYDEFERILKQQHKIMRQQQQHTHHTDC